jgi:hypothetical protein
MKKLFGIVISLIISALLLSCSGGASDNTKPNILFVIMDDVGVDQMQSFGYGGDVPPAMPNMNAVAAAGVRFRNTWSMPECSPGRAAMFVGRFPLRTNINAALGPYDLASAQTSPFEMTTPKLLKQAGYESAMFGKFHLAGPDNNQAENGTPFQLGWDYFYGWIRGGPASLDTTGGGVAATGTYECGFIPTKAVMPSGGADTGACYQPDSSCRVISEVSLTGDAPGKQCVIGGGLFVPDAGCQSPAPGGLNFSIANGYYVSPLVINNPDGSVEIIPNTDSRNRGYRTTIETDAAISWINSRTSGKPWMATVSYSAAHTPYQQAPGSLVPGDSGDDLSCLDLLQQKDISNKMTEALDTEFGRLLVQTGLATKNNDGSLVYDPKAKNTVIVIVGDNGTFTNAVKTPFDSSRAKATAYQTGVWVPLIVAGPVVASPNRDVAHMINTVDIFQLFGELAGINVPRAVPRVVDSAPLLPYLVNPNQASLRSVNFTQGGYNLQANGQRNGACIVNTKVRDDELGSVCTQSIFDKGPCEENSGVWWGPGYDDPSVVSTVGHDSSIGYRSCWQVNQALYKDNQPMVSVAPEVTIAVRNNTYKLVRNTVQTYDTVNDTGGPVTSDEFYQVDQSTPTPLLDTESLNLMPTKLSWSDELTSNYNSLVAKMNAVLASQPACPGDGNIDGVVDAADNRSYLDIVIDWVLSSVYDFNFDGNTDSADQGIINSNQGNCPAATATY